MTENERMSMDIVIEIARHALDGRLDELGIGSDAEAWETVMAELVAVDA
jgi:hypothetical protein